jgi:hypothetical protein
MRLVAKTASTKPSPETCLACCSTGSVSRAKTGGGAVNNGEIPRVPGDGL